MQATTGGPEPVTPSSTSAPAGPLHVELCGRGRPLVILPSFSLDHAAMAETVEPVLADRTGWRRLYIDLPGTGGSSSGEPQSDDVLDAVIGTIRAELGDERFAVAGWSYGGYLAAGLTRRLPEQVSGVMMICSGFKIRPEDRDLTGVLASTPRPGWLTRVPPELHDHLVHAVGAQTSQVADRIADVLGRNGPTDEVYLDSLRAAGFALSDEEAPTLCDAPVCLLAGRRDRVIGFASLSVAAGSYDNATSITVSNAGHYLPLEHPAVFAAATQAWLSECQAHLGTGGD